MPLKLYDRKEWARHVYWMFTIVLGDNLPLECDEIMSALAEDGIETRPVFYPMHTLPLYQALCQGQRFPTAERIAARGISLPTWVGGVVEKGCKTFGEATMEGN